MFFQVVSQYFTDSLVYGTHYFVVTQLRFGLSLELWFGYFNGNNGSQTFAEVVSRDFNFHLFQHLAVFGVFLQRTGQCTAETGKMRTSFDCIDIIDIGMYIFGESCIVHNGYFNRYSLLLRVQIDNVVDQVFT